MERTTRIGCWGGSRAVSAKPVVCRRCGEALGWRRLLPWTRICRWTRVCSTCRNQAMFQEQVEERADIHDGFKPLGSGHYVRQPSLSNRYSPRSRD
jgi:hypothetical protein